MLDPFFNYFRKQADPDESLYELCYLSAYDALPAAFEKAPMEFWSVYSRAVQPAYAWYLHMCLLTGTTPSRYDGATFRWHKGHLESGRGYLVLEYPEPLPVELSVKEFDKGERSTPSLRLYPYFSAVLPEIPEHPAGCYALGQSPVDGLTTLRWCRTAAHYGLGRGPRPTLNDFLDVLTEIQEFPVESATVRHEDYLDPKDNEILGHLERQ